MSPRTRMVLGAVAALGVAGVAAGAAAAQASARPPRPQIFIIQPTALRFFSNTGPITGFPAAPLVPGDRVIGQDRIIQSGVPAGHDNEVCTVSFNRDVLCQDIVILDGRGDLQASWTFRWPASGTRGPASFDGIIDGGTARFRAAHGSFRAQALPDGDLRITAAINSDD